MKTPKDKIFYVFDNQGETLDRYTIILQDYSMYGASTSPFDALGFGQYCGDIHKDSLEEARNNPEFLGVEINDISKLPKDVIKYIELMSEDL